MTWLDRLFVIPIHPKEKRPLEAGWQLRVALWQDAPGRWPGVTRWGAPQGPVNESWILDVDAKSRGLATLAELEKKHGPLPVTRVTATPGGGLHYWFRWDPALPVGTWVGRLQGIDTRGAGGQVVIPPTAGYTWQSDAPIAQAPAWLYEALDVRPPRPTPAHAGDRPPGLPRDLEGARADVLAADPCRPGEFGKAVFRLALRLVRGRGLDPDEAADLLEELYEPKCGAHEVAQEHGGTRRACQRAATHAHAAPWGFTWYHGEPAEVVLRSIRRYGPEGALSSCVPYRVFPDGTMLQLDYFDGLRNAMRGVACERGETSPALEVVEHNVRWWRQVCPSSGEMPLPIALDDQPGPSLARLTTAEGPTSAWDEFLTRLDAPDTFLAWVWMLVLPRATRQVLWIQGAGHDGKTQVSGVLHQALGRASTSADDTFTNESERWLGGQVYGKRLAVIDDTKMRECLRRGVVHRLTGGSTLKCEAKGVDGFDFTPNCAVLCTSNWAPEIGDTAADRSRLLMVTVRPLDQALADPDWRDRLLAEFPALLSRAREAYKHLAAKPGVPQLRLEPTVAAHLDKAAGADSRTWEAVLEQANLVLDPALTIRSAELLNVVRLDQKGQRALADWLYEQGCRKEKDKKGAKWVGVGRPA